MDAKICKTYIDKYRDNLIGHVITSQNTNEPILVDRTNHVPEQHFGNTKSGLRRRLGTKNMTRHFQGSRQEEFLVPNLDNQDYINTVYEGSLNNMPEYFAKNWEDGKKIRDQLAEKNSNHPIPVSKKTLRHTNLLTNLEEGIKNLFDNKSLEFSVETVESNQSGDLKEQSKSSVDENVSKKSKQKSDKKKEKNEAA